MGFSSLFSFSWVIFCGVGNLRLLLILYALHLRGPHMLVHHQQMTSVRFTVPFLEMWNSASRLSAELPLLSDRFQSVFAAGQPVYGVTENKDAEIYKRRLSILRRLSGVTDLQLQPASASVTSTCHSSARNASKLQVEPHFYEDIPEAEKSSVEEKKNYDPLTVNVDVEKRKKASPSLLEQTLGGLNSQKTHMRAWMNLEREARPRKQRYNQTQTVLLETSPVTMMRRSDEKTYRWRRGRREEVKPDYYMTKKLVPHDFVSAGERSALHQRGPQLVATAQRSSVALVNLILTHVAIAFAAFFGAAAYRLASESAEMKETIAALAEKNRAIEEELKFQSTEQPTRKGDSQEEKPQREVSETNELKATVSNVKDYFLKLPTAMKSLISGHLVMLVLSRIFPLWMSMIPAYLIMRNYRFLEQIGDSKAEEFPELAFRGAWKIPLMVSKLVDSFEDFEKTSKRAISTLTLLLLGSYLLSPTVISLMLLTAATAREYKEKQKLPEEADH